MYGSANRYDGRKRWKKVEAQESEKLTWDKLEGIAFGQLGMSVEDFYDMIPKHFYNKLSGFFDLEQMRERNEWERCRWQTCYLLNIQIAKGKKLKLTDLIKFDWDKKDEVDVEELKNKAEYIKKLEEYGK